MAVITFLPYRWWSNYGNNLDHNRGCGCRATRAKVWASLSTSYAHFIFPDKVVISGRSTVFFYRFCTDLIADLFTPPITSLLMNKNLWIPLLLAVAFQGISAVIASGLPETLPLADLEHSNGNEDSSPVATTSPEIDKHSTLNFHWMSWLRQVIQSFSFVTRHRAITALVFTFLISKVGRQATNILFQYVSKKYMWTVSEVSIHLCFASYADIR